MSGMGSAAPGMVACAIRENIEEMRRNRGWILLMGICLVVLGCIAVSSSFVATLATMLYLGIMLLVGGIIEIIGAFWARHWGGFFLELLMGVLLVLAGLIALNHPEKASLILTLMLAFFFMAGGVVRIIAAFSLRFTHWGWVVLSGIVSILVGLIIWRSWPESGLWVIGTFVGVELIFSGWNYVALASWLRQTKPAGT